MSEYVEPEFDTDVEQRRRAIVDDLGIGSLRERPVFGHVAEAVAAELDASIAKVSLIGADTQYLLAEVGLGVDRVPRAESVCNHPLATGEVFIVENAAEHARLEDNPYVEGEPHVRFYVGIPLIVDSVPVGTICGVDSSPKPLSWQSRSSVFRIVGLVERLLSARLGSREGESPRRFSLLEELTSAEAHAVRLAASEELGREGRRAMMDLRAALHGAEESAKSFREEPDTELGHLPTSPEPA